ncbi:MAG: YceI family protein [Marinoscillum sp.]|uniref:YceI family protein n=1 Tax=Marinoscillum sp. TaxID=2024838 RepID=UPI0032FAA4CD
MKFLLALLLISGLTTGQWEFKSAPTQSSMTILGTSSLHDWESEVGDFVVSGTMAENLISNLKVEVNVESIKSGKSIMDDKTYDALKSEKFPTIYFAAESLTLSGGKATGLGVLTLAGESRTITLEAETAPKGANAVQVDGKVSIKMSDYGIDPPTAMFGTLITGDQVTIQYQLLLNK